MLSSAFFLVLTAGVFGFFAYNLRKTWLLIGAVGHGKEELRSDSLGERFFFMLREGLWQKRMFKEPVAGVMHFFIFWGFITVSLGTVETLISGVIPSFDLGHALSHNLLWQIFSLSQDWGNLVVLLAVTYAIMRRAFFPPKRLEGILKSAKIDAYLVLGFIWGLVFTALLYIGCQLRLLPDPSQAATSLYSAWSLSSLLAAITGIESSATWALLSKIIWWLHVTVLFSFITFLPFSKHQHLIWVWPNMFFKSKHRTGRLRPMEFAEDAESFGVGKVNDFTWKQLLDGKTCVECGRCTSVCPANGTGKKLDPRLMIHHLKESLIEGAKPPEERKELVGGIVTSEELWDCTTCGACMEACPLHIEHIPTIVDMRRFMSMTQGDMPAELQATMQNIETHSNPWGMSNETRADWANGLDVTTMAEKSDVEYLFWVGCAGSFDDRYKKVSKSIVKIMQKAGVSFSILGTEEQCNGDTARRAGNEYLANALITANVETMKGYKVKKIVTGCPHCFNTIKNEYPDFGFNAEVIHHTELIQNLIEAKKVQPKDIGKVDQTLTYHDSCYLGRHNDIYEEPRKSLESFSGKKMVEMPRTKDNGFCCGAGGARMWMEEHVGERINVNRTKEAVATGASTVATACPFCMTMLSDGLKDCGKAEEIKVQDVAEIVADSL